MIYLDNNATTRPDGSVVEAMLPFIGEIFGNPSSAHSAGEDARKAIAEGRSSVAELIGAERAGEIVFTSGGTESDNWAITGALRAAPDRFHIITTRVEHEAVRNQCKRLEAEGCLVSWIDVDSEGRLDLDQLRHCLTPKTAVVSVMMANNETGVIFPVDEIAEMVKANSDALFHVDGVNAAGKIPINLKDTKVDLFSISAHKFHGPKGIGALYIRDGVQLPSMSIGGGQESGRRAGTEAVHQIVGMGAAARCVSDLGPMAEVHSLRDHLENELLRLVPESYVNGTRDADSRLPNTSNISFSNTNGEVILAMLDDLRICVSTGSACNSATHTASPVLEAMNIPYMRSMGSIRFSLGRENTADEIGRVIEVLPGIVEKIRAIG